MLSISIVIPVFNSHDILPNLLLHIEKERVKEGWNLELIMVDDGSKDESFSQIKKLTQKYNYIKGFRLSRNYGHQAAVRFGLEKVTQKYVAIIDDDMQDPPSLLPRFLTKLGEGYDVVYGVRKKRKENFIKVFFYKIFYKILSAISEISIPLDSGDFCVMRKNVVDAMMTLKERNPFLRGIRSWVGFKQIGLEYEREAPHSWRIGIYPQKTF